MTNNTETSGIWNAPDADISSFSQNKESFSECKDIPTDGFARLIKAKRNGRWWMLKGLKPEFANQPLYQELLHKEYSILNQMQHPSIVQVIGMCDVAPYGMCIIMEYVDGVSLADYLQKPVSREIKIRIVSNLMDALEYVHSKQIVHRDLKPQNIIITHNGQNLKLIDFGLADTDNYYLLKQPAGTLKYMSPEQRNTNLADVRNDIYSLGVIVEAMHLGWPFVFFRKGCKRDIKHRYKNITAARKAFLMSQKLPLFICASIAVACVVSASVWFYNKEDISIDRLKSSHEQLVRFHANDSLTILRLNDSLAKQSQESALLFQKFNQREKEKAERIQREQVEIAEMTAYQQKKDEIIREGKRLIDAECRRCDKTEFSSAYDLSVALEQIKMKIGTYMESQGKVLTSIDFTDAKNTITLYYEKQIKERIDKWATKIKQ